MSLLDLQAAVGWAVVHFLWQGALIGAVAWSSLRVLGRADAEARHGVALLGLGASAAAFLSTVVWAWPASTAALVVDGIMASSAAAIEGANEALPDGSGPPAPIAWVWALGVLLLSLRLALGAREVSRLRRGTATPPGWLQRDFDELRRAMGVSSRVALAITSRVGTPIVVGVLQPLVLVPASSLSLLTPEQLRTVLAHELAHVRRFDPLFNSIIAALQVLLFFHPVVWWLARVVREERELCCDRLAVRATGDGLALAQALTRLESLRLHPSAALAAQPRRGSLMTRITRILQPRDSGASAGARLRAMAAAATLALGAGVAHGAITDTVLEPAASSQEARQEYAELSERLDRLVQRGWMTEEEMKRVLGTVGRRMKASAARRDAASDARFEAFAGQIKLAVAEGWMTEEEAKRTLGAAKRRMAGEGDPFGSQEGEEARRREVEAARIRAERDHQNVRNRLDLAIEEGRISPEQAKERMGRYLRDREERGRVEAEKRAWEQRRRRLEEFKQDLWSEVEAGNVEAKDAERLLIEAQKKLFGDTKPDEAKRTDMSVRDLEVRAGVARELDAAARRFADEVTKGELTKEDARAKLEDLRRELELRAKSSLEHGAIQRLRILEGELEATQERFDAVKRAKEEQDKQRHLDLEDAKKDKPSSSLQGGGGR